MKKFLLSILCCLMAVVNGYAQGSDDFGTYFTKTNSGYASGTTTAGWEYANAAIVSIDNTFAPTINGKTSAKGTIISPTLAGGCGTLSLKYAYTFSESKGVSFKVTIKQGGADVASYDVVNTSATKSTVYEWKQDVNVQGDFVIYITNNSPSNSTSNKDRFSIWNIEWTAYGQASVPQLDAPVISPESCTFDTETFDVTISAKDDATIYYTLDGSDPTENSEVYDGVITLTETTTVKAIAIKGGYENSDVVEETYTKKEIIEGQVEDIITIDLIGETGSSYTSWRDKRSNSTAVYAGQSISNADNIQLRSDKDKNNNYSGVVTTTSGGKVKKIIVEWGGATANGRTLNIYGKNDAYSNPNDLYDNTKSGTKLGTIVKGTSTELEITGDYTYVGLRSNSSAMYITSITIIWEVADEEPEQTYTLNVTGAGYATFTSNKNYIIPAGVEGGIVTVEGTTANVNYVYAEGDIVPAGTGLLMKGEAGEYKMYATTEEATEVYAENLLKGALTNDVITAPANTLLYIFANDSESGLGFYWQKNSNNGQQVQNMAGKAYLQVPTTSAVKGFRLNMGDTTGITAVESTLGNAPVYTLSGVRVSSNLNNLPAGIYIVGGKKVYVK
ncbi:MAG: chitobiase/beta-hexosaminidase C-terminal domain-containing protein [Bacteroidaceae bacterium]|nr:chitobiase/beta-hexosaminidase C-terminal domain-containing protein [Bacteroidaceae bacterium]